MLVRDHIPLEQGLRRSKGTRGSRSTCQRPYSIRTRIKTKKLLTAPAKGVCQRPYSIRTRIKTNKWVDASLIKMSETIFH